MINGLSGDITKISLLIKLLEIHELEKIISRSPSLHYPHFNGPLQHKCNKLTQENIFTKISQQAPKHGASQSGIILF